MGFTDILFKLGQIKFDKGYLLINGMPKIIVPADLMVDLYFNANPEQVYIFAKRAALDWLADVSKNFNMPRKKFVDLAPRVVQFEGWGVFDMHVEENSLHVLVNPSVFAQRYLEKFGKSDRPVCDLLRGYMAALAEYLFGGKYTAEELRCKAQGAPVCEFVVRRQE